MSKQTKLRQVYYPEDDGRQVDAKFDRLRSVIYTGGIPLQVEVTRYQKKRSPEANAYLWAVCYALMSEASGYEREEIHAAMCRKFFGTTIVEVMGERFERPVRTTTTNEDGELEWLGVMEFAEFVDFVIREAAYWYDVIVPPPTPKQVPREVMNRGA